ncbi:hypothetical protein B4U80_00788 [Leptotrombidium deliense]|uniref:Potassium channel domain-containing protein n=1 Tax=Leptotrombidium deliense TaxID=299467 RepID=A0A443SU90_9ACAR|nr:hypothetical protein B4U80_00788 [Leptotrombidium deliense]
MAVVGRQQRSRAVRYRDYCRAVATFLFSHIGLCAMVAAYSTSGAALFQFLEKDYEMRIRDEVEQQRDRYAEQLWIVTANQDNVLKKENWSEHAVDVLHQFEEYLLNVSKRHGFDGKDKSDVSRWTFMGALLYSIIVITTIGYGDRVPLTLGGKIATIFYAIAGIPLMLLFLSNIGDVMANSFKFIYWKLYTNHHDASQVPIISNKYALRSDTIDVINHSRFTFPQPLYNELEPNFGTVSHATHSMQTRTDDSESDEESDEEEQSSYKEVNVPISMCLSLLIGYICIGGKLFKDLEGWEYLEGFYFCFVTLTTIGFGDYVPGQKLIYSAATKQVPGEKFTDTLETETTLILVACACYLVFGLGLVAMSLNLFRDTVADNVRQIGEKIGIIKSESDSE